MTCVQCGEQVDAIFHEESGGLCGYCLADYGFVVHIGKRSDDPIGEVAP